MKGSPVIISALNDVLTAELTAINQYFLHARMLEDWGLAKLGKLEYDASIDEMKHSDEIIKRILFLEGLPNLQKLSRLRIGQNVKEILEADLAVEMEAVPRLKEAIALAETESDFVTRDLFQSILESEEHHVDWLETQLNLLTKLGEQNYIQSQINPNAAN
ncbi:MAG: bacterioferritin [Halobacteriovoraceae bacterium]|nr:bacterioferritin [Halobacteriovoraceae bacterium]|tara:strand:+ start:6075 stop:6557 length:483 start_codon:yes stop_codon:yes gene_type:complete